jgi:hypothetical protein
MTSSALNVVEQGMTLKTIQQRTFMRIPPTLEEVEE